MVMRDGDVNASESLTIRILKDAPLPVEAQAAAGDDGISVPGQGGFETKKRTAKTSKTSKKRLRGLGGLRGSKFFPYVDHHTWRA